MTVPAIPSPKIDQQAYTGLSEKQLAGIGFIALSWSGVEMGLSALIWDLAGMKSEIGRLVTTDLGNVSKATLFQNLVHQTINEPRLFAECEDLIFLYDHLRVQRNSTIHGIVKWGPSDDDGSFLVKESAKGGKGRVSQTVIDVSLETLDQLGADMVLCSEAIRQIYNKIWNFKFFYRAHLKSDPTTASDFVHRNTESSDQIVRLQTRLAGLYPKRHAQRSNQHPHPPLLR
jgi:hypothetical protein